MPDWTGGAVVRQRVLRSGRWKPCCYAGYRSQLFDLETDPQDLRDQAPDPAFATLRGQLTRRMLAGRNPTAIRARMAKRRTAKDLLTAWARTARPQSEHLWPLLPEQKRPD